MKPRLLDLYCGAGGAAAGYMAAGFDVTGVDIRRQPHYPGRFIEADALDHLAAGGAAGFDAVHASPPCQRYATVTRWTGNPENHPDLVAPTIAALRATGLPWVVENVPEAPLRRDVFLCGSMFGLRVRRHRIFETSWGMYTLIPPCRHHGILWFAHKQERAYADAMGCTWMSAAEAREAIPPAYTAFIGTYPAAEAVMAA